MFDKKKKRAEYYIKNKQKELKADKEWIKANSSKRNEILRKWRLKNSDKIKATGKAYYKKNRENILKRLKEQNIKQDPLKKLNAYLKKNYKIDSIEYNVMLKEQNNVCLICKNKCKSGQRLCVDHDHFTGRIRGLLCRSCNIGIGNLKDDIKLLESAIKYLKG